MKKILMGIVLFLQGFVSGFWQAFPDWYKHVTLFLFGLLIGGCFGYGLHWGMTEYQRMPTSAYPPSAGSQCLQFGRFCESQEEGGLCFDCTVI